jgi:hypothetical protein
LPLKLVINLMIQIKDMECHKTLHHLGFVAQLRNPPSILRPNREKPSPVILRLNH